MRLVSRVLQLLGIAFIMLATRYAFLPNFRNPAGAFGITLIVAMVVGLVLIAVRWWAGYSAMKRMVTRSLEVTFSVVYLVVVAPLFVLIAVAIKLESPGPVFWQQAGQKKDGATFQMVRFRCHAAGVTEQVHPTLVGRILRRFRLDEMPMVLNVVRGDASLNKVMRFGDALQIPGPPERHERAVWIVLLSLLAVLFVLAAMLRR